MVCAIKKTNKLEFAKVLLIKLLMGNLPEFPLPNIHDIRTVMHRTCYTAIFFWLSYIVNLKQWLYVGPQLVCCNTKTIIYKHSI